MEYVLATLGIGFILVIAVKMFGKSKSKIRNTTNRDYLVDGKESREEIPQDRK